MFPSTIGLFQVLRLAVAPVPHLDVLDAALLIDVAGGLLVMTIYDDVSFVVLPPCVESSHWHLLVVI